MPDIELNIINAHAFEQGKRYLVEVDANQVSMKIVDELPRALKKLGIRAVIVQTHGGVGIRVVEPQEEP